MGNRFFKKLAIIILKNNKKWLIQIPQNIMLSETNHLIHLVEAEGNIQESYS